MSKELKKKEENLPSVYGDILTTEDFKGHVQEELTVDFLRIRQTNGAKFQSDGVTPINGFEPNGIRIKVDAPNIGKELKSVVIIGSTKTKTYFENLGDKDVKCKSVDGKHNVDGVLCSICPYGNPEKCTDGRALIIYHQNEIKILTITAGMIKEWRQYQKEIRFNKEFKIQIGNKKHTLPLHYLNIDVGIKPTKNNAGAAYFTWDFKNTKVIIDQDKILLMKELHEIAIAEYIVSEVFDSDSDSEILNEDLPF